MQSSVPTLEDKENKNRDILTLQQKQFLKLKSIKHLSEEKQKEIESYLKKAISVQCELDPLLKPSDHPLLFLKSAEEKKHIEGTIAEQTSLPKALIEMISSYFLYMPSINDLLPDYISKLFFKEIINVIQFGENTECKINRNGSYKEPIDLFQLHISDEYKQEVNYFIAQQKPELKIKDFHLILHQKGFITLDYSAGIQSTEPFFTPAQIEIENKANSLVERASSLTRVEDMNNFLTEYKNHLILDVLTDVTGADIPVLSLIWTQFVTTLFNVIRDRRWLMVLTQPTPIVGASETERKNTLPIVSNVKAVIEIIKKKNELIKSHDTGGKGCAKDCVIFLETIQFDPSFKAIQNLNNEIATHFLENIVETIQDELSLYIALRNEQGEIKKETIEINARRARAQKDLVNTPNSAHSVTLYESPQYELKSAYKNDEVLFLWDDFIEHDLDRICLDQLPEELSKRIRVIRDKAREIITDRKVGNFKSYEAFLGKCNHFIRFIRNLSLKQELDIKWVEFITTLLVYTRDRYWLIELGQSPVIQALEKRQRDKVMRQAKTILRRKNAVIQSDEPLYCNAFLEQINVFKSTLPQLNEADFLGNVFETVQEEEAFCMLRELQTFFPTYITDLMIEARRFLFDASVVKTDKNYNQFLLKEYNFIASRSRRTFNWYYFFITIQIKPRLTLLFHASDSLELPIKNNKKIKFEARQLRFRAYSITLNDYDNFLIECERKRDYIASLCNHNLTVLSAWDKFIGIVHDKKCLDLLVHLLEMNELDLELKNKRKEQFFRFLYIPEMTSLPTDIKVKIQLHIIKIIKSVDSANTWSDYTNFLRECEQKRTEIISICKYQTILSEFNYFIGALQNEKCFNLFLGSLEIKKLPRKLQEKIKDLAKEMFYCKYALCRKNPIKDEDFVQFQKEINLHMRAINSLIIFNDKAKLAFKCFVGALLGALFIGVLSTALGLFLAGAGGTISTGLLVIGITHHLLIQGTLLSAMLGAGVTGFAAYHGYCFGLFKPVNAQFHFERAVVASAQMELKHKSSSTSLKSNVA